SAASQSANDKAAYAVPENRFSVGSLSSCPVFVAHQLSASVSVAGLWGLWAGAQRLSTNPQASETARRSGSRCSLQSILHNDALGVVARQQTGPMEYRERGVRIGPHLDP